MPVRAFPQETVSGRSWSMPLFFVTSLLALFVLSSCGHSNEANRIVSLSPTATEILYAIGAGEKVVAVDDQSTFPASAPRKNISGLHPDVNAVVSYNPDLVVVTTDAQDPNGTNIVSELKNKGIRVLLQPAPRTLEDAYGQIETLGIEAGLKDKAASLVKKMMEDINAVVVSTPKLTRPLKYYHELDTEYNAASSEKFIGSVYELFSLHSIADPLDETGSGYRKMSSSDIIKANPDLIFLADTKCCGQRVSTVAARAGWSQIAAVKRGQVIELDDDIASRWGPRLVDFARAVSNAIKTAK